MDTQWLYDQCECGGDLYYDQAPELPEGDIYEETEMLCSSEECDLITTVSFNDDGSTWSTSSE